MIQQFDFSGIKFYEMYDLLGEIGSRYKYNQEEFQADIVLFSKGHKKCGFSCMHVDYFLKKMIILRHV